jgi:hypothetical protein
MKLETLRRTLTRHPWLRSWTLAEVSEYRGFFRSLRDEADGADAGADAEVVAL